VVKSEGCRQHGVGVFGCSTAAPSRGAVLWPSCLWPQFRTACMAQRARVWGDGRRRCRADGRGLLGQGGMPGRSRPGITLLPSGGRGEMEGLPPSLPCAALPHLPLVHDPCPPCPPSLPCPPCRQVVILPLQRPELFTRGTLTKPTKGEPGLAGWGRQQCAAAACRLPPCFHARACTAEASAGGLHASRLALAGNTSLLHHIHVAPVFCPSPPQACCCLAPPAPARQC